MKFLKWIVTMVPLFLILATTATAQQTATPKSGDNPIYKITINVVDRTATAINYRHRSGSTTIDFKGTPLLPKARGEAKVESKQGYIEVEVEFDDLQPATRFGPEFLTYVMWAISPEGRAVNLGEVILNGTKSKLDVSSDLQAFGLIVTAEPYFAVTQPSDVVVMENFIREETRGQIEKIDAKYELLQRGQYTTNVLPADLKPILLEKNVPLDLYEARNAVRIARWAGADKNAPDSYSKAELLLQQAEDKRVHKQWKELAMMSREAVQTAEDSRLITLKKMDENRLAAERAASADREAEQRARADRARADADQSALLRTQAEQQQQIESQRRALAESEKAAAEANAARTRVEADAAERSRAQAQLDAQRAALDAKNSADARKAAEADADRARQATAKAEREKQELREQLIAQFNLILQTRDSARGLIVNMSDVLFDTAQYSLKPGAREKLAKISGIVLAHPGLRLEVEGHTDSVGTDEYNQKLSENRADAVRTFLIQQGVSSTSITARGFGKSQPVASNDTASGRQTNRRVEMVVSGDIIGTPIKTSSLGN